MQLFFLRNSLSDKFSINKPCIITYGTTSASYLETRCLLELSNGYYDELDGFHLKKWCSHETSLHIYSEQEQTKNFTDISDSKTLGVY